MKTKKRFNACPASEGRDGNNKHPARQVQEAGGAIGRANAPLDTLGAPELPGGWDGASMPEGWGGAQRTPEASRASAEDPRRRATQAFGGPLEYQALIALCMEANKAGPKHSPHGLSVWELDPRLAAWLIALLVLWAIKTLALG